MFEVSMKRLKDVVNANDLLGEEAISFFQKGESLMVMSNKSVIEIQKVVDGEFEPFIIDVLSLISNISFFGGDKGKLAFKKTDQGVSVAYGGVTMPLVMLNEMDITSSFSPPKSDITFETKISSDDLESLTKRLNIGESFGLENTQNVFLVSKKGEEFEIQDEKDKKKKVKMKKPDTLSLIGTDGHIAFKSTFEGDIKNEFTLLLPKSEFKPLRYLIRNIPKSMSKAGYTLRVTSTRLYIEGDGLKVSVSLKPPNKDVMNLYSLSRYFSKENEEYKEIKILDFENIKENIKNIKKENEEKILKVTDDKVYVYDQKEVMVVDKFNISTDYEMGEQYLVGLFSHFKEVIDDDNDILYIKDVEFKDQNFCIIRKDVSGGEYIFAVGKRDKKRKR